MMLLYHGTSEAVARLALTEGLRPRNATGSKGNWKKGVESRPDLVYLTTAYAPYFAMAACDKDGSKLWGLIEVDSDRLDESMLVPDEDYLEQGTRRTEIPKDSFWSGLRRAKKMETRLAWFRQRLHAFAHHWPDSVAGLGNCAHFGTIPPGAITRIVLYDPKHNLNVSLGLVDPSINLINYQLCGEKYRALTRWFMGYNVEPEEVLQIPEGLSMNPDDPIPPGLEQFAAIYRPQYRGWKDALADRGGFTFLRPA